MKLSKTLWCVSFIVTAVFLMPVLAVTPLGQIDSFDDIVATDWNDTRGTGLMEQDDANYEGTGSIRVKFEDMDPCEWDVDLERVISLNLDYNVPVALTFWVDTNVTMTTDDECVKELILFEGDNIARFAVPGKNAGWRKITAGTGAFTLDPCNVTDFNWAAIDRIQFWCSTWDTPGGSVWIDDLRLELAPPKNSPCQLASFEDIAAEGWYDARYHGWMLQAPPGEVNEDAGSMKMAFTLWETGENVDIEPIMNFYPPLDLSDYRNLAITLWVWSDRSNSEFREIILYDDASHNGRFVAHPPDSNGWTKVVANLTEFAWYNDGSEVPISPDDANLSSIKTIGLFSSCGTVNNDIYLDDLRLDSNQVFLSDATIVNADRTFGTITVDGNAADWDDLVDSDVVDFDLATVPVQPNGNLHVQYRLAWDPNYLYILVEEVPGDLLVKEANQVGGLYQAWSLNDQLGGDAYYDALALYFDFTNTHYVLGGREGISLWLYLGLASHGQTNLMMAWTNAQWSRHKPAAIVNGQYAETGTGLGNRVVEAKVKWSDLDDAINPWFLPEGGLAAAIKPGYIFGCNPRVNDFEKSTLWGSPTVERGTAWLNGQLWDWQGTPSATGIYAKDVRLVCSAGDLDFDCHVDFVDYAQFAEKWLNDGCNNLNGFCNGADIVINGEVTMEDLAKLALRWLE